VTVIDMEKPQLGVFICRCGLSIAQSVDTTALAEYVKTLSDVIHVEELEFSCSDMGQKIITETIVREGLNRIVIAGCSPWQHERTFQRALQIAGLNKFLLEMANIKEHVALLYPGQILKATEKAKSLVKAAVERARTLEPIETIKMKVQQSVLVIGGGVAGTEAAKRLGDLGLEVFLVEKTSFIGGKALQLGSVFPTDDCGQCISPCGNELHRRCFYRSPVAYHPYIHLLTNTTLKKLDGHIGKYKAHLEVQPRYITPELCVACDKCTEVCPIEVSNQFNLGLDKRKAAYLLSDQALPRTYTIDMGACIKCGKCVDICPTSAINLEMKSKEVDVDVGAVLVATGFEQFDATGMYGYGEYPDVINQLELARMLDKSGPTQGRVIRPSDGKTPKRIAMIQCVGSRSDGKTPKRIAMIQCVGSRDLKTNEYCSKICCAVAMKHAVDIAENIENTGIAIIHKDIRLTGKYYEDYYYRAQDLGVNLLRGDVDLITQKGDGSLSIDVSTPSETQSMNVDLVVLSTGMVPSKGTEQLSKILGISLSQDNFFAERGPKLEPLDTSVEGIYICGTCHGPKDIQESITQALGASSRIASLLIKGDMEIDRAKASVDHDLCVACGACVSACPFNAIEWKAFGRPEVIEAACESCGICAAVCPVSAMQLKHYKDDQLIPKIRGLLNPKWDDPDNKEPVIITFACQWCSYAAADAAGTMGMEYPENVRIIRVPCTGRLPDQCNYLDGNLKAIDRVDIMRKTLDVLGIGGNRLETIFTSACMPTWLVLAFREFTERIRSMNSEKGAPNVEKIPVLGK